MDSKSTIAADQESPKFSKARALSARLGVSTKTLFRWADDGKIARFKINERVVLFNDAEVFAFVTGSKIHSCN